MKTKTLTKKLLLLFVAFVISGIAGQGNVYAETQVEKGVFTDANDIRWEYQLQTPDEGDQVLSIFFYDKPETLQTVTVPSLNEVLSKVPSASSNLNTYFLKDADDAAQDTNYTDLTRRAATKETKKLDMTNTSKIQIVGVAPIIDPTVETELVFGQNMVISDATKNGKMVRASICGTMYYSSYNDYYYCYDSYNKYFPLPDYRSMTAEEIASFSPSYADYGLKYYRDNVTSLTYDSDKSYANNISVVNAELGAFSFYKLKLTNFDASNFNYVGWDAFAFSEFADTTMTVSGDTLLGGDIFKGTNIKKAIVNTEALGTGIFRDCADLEEVEFADSVHTIAADTFAGAGLTSFDFSTTKIKTIGPRAFEGASLAEINLEGVERIEYEAFKDNDIRELYLPRSINYLQSQLFKGNGNMKKLTVAYDTLTSGTTLPMFVVLDNNYGAGKNSGDPSGSIEELHVIAPYDDDDELSTTHVSYGDYLWRFNAYDQRYMPECPDNTSCNGNSAAGNDYVHAQYGAWDSSYYSMSASSRANYLGSGSDFEKRYAHVDTYKNVIAPIYFANMLNLHNITIGDGYEFIGASAFQDWSGSYSNMGHGKVLVRGRGVENTGYALNMPDSLRGIGNGAFVHKFQDSIDFTIPRDIEFIGINAFFNTYFYDKDVDFPNLVALGDHAFEKTRAKNVHLYDKLQYMGAQVFADCLFLNDITFDLDVFNPDIYIAWALPHRHGPEWYDGQFHLTTEFGPTYPYSFSRSEIEEFGIRVSEDRDIYNHWPLQFGTITFTDKNVSQLPNGYHNCYYFENDYNPQGSTNCPGGHYGTGIYNTFFGHLNADKIDIGDTNWKVLSARMFVQTNIGEVILPKNLEVIPGDSFSDSVIKEELILPDSIKVIGDAAFDFGQIYSYARNWSTGEINEEYLNNHTIHITKLPKSLEYLGDDAFWGDYGLTADLNSPNLRHVGWKVFWGTRLRDVYLPPTIKALHAAAFANIKTLRNITIDFDLGALPPNYDEGMDPNDFPQSLREYAGANLYQLVHMSCSAHHMANSSDYPVTTFYSLFNQGNVSDEKDSNGRIITYGQKEAHTHYGKVVFTDKNQTDIYMTGTGYFGGLEFDELDMSAAGWKSIVTVPWAFESTKIGKLKLPQGLETVTMGAFESAEIEQPFTWPSTLKTINTSAFQWAKGMASNTFAEGLEDIQYGAFYAADIADEMVIPSTVKSIGMSAFNAGDADVHYEKVTIKPDLNYDMDNHQMIHQMFWQNDIKEMVIESSELPVTNRPGGRGEEEFYAMPLEKVTFTNIPIITADAFLNNTKLKEVDLSKDANLRVIADEAFLNDEKLHIIKFSPDLKQETVTIGQHAFQGTAFETMGDSSTDFDLTAAKFDGSRGLAFAEMPRLRSVSIPDDFSKDAIPVGTFHNDGELVEATVDYRINKMETGAFSNDDNLERIFIWGNTVIEDEKLENYTAPIASAINARLANVTLDTGEEIDTADFGVTIPESTDIYAYSVSPTESYAAAQDREEFDSDFYALDEVLYITSNKPRVLLNDDEDDFDKSNLVVYGLRRDGVILQSNSWGEFDGTVYARADSNLTFERMAGFQEENPVYGAVYDTPVPLNQLDYGNVNFENIGFELIRDPDNASVRLVNIIYTDKYTEGKPDTDIDPNAPVDEPGVPEVIEKVIEKVKEILPETPFTGDNIAAYVISFVALSAVVTIFIAVKRRK